MAITRGERDWEEVEEGVGRINGDGEKKTRGCLQCGVTKAAGKPLGSLGWVK